MKSVDFVAAVLVIIGALNWGLVGALHLDLVHAIFGASLLASIVYVLVGIAGVFQLVRLLSASQHRSLAHA